MKVKQELNKKEVFDRQAKKSNIELRIWINL